MMSLDTGPSALGDRIDLWLAYYDEFAQEAPRLLDLLNESERQQQARFHFADDRLRYLVTRAMVRTVLSRYADVNPADWTFDTNAYGRPEIASAHSAAKTLCFNLSHTRGLIVLGVCREFAMGVDVEQQERAAALEVAERFFSPTEAAELAALAPERQLSRFFDYWTLKESYIKARGMGLSIPLDRFSFDFPSRDTVRLSLDASLGDDARRWRFWQLNLPGNYKLAVCHERTVGMERTPSLRRMNTLDSFEILTPDWVRASGG
ncbi:4'-phosphopantetheinyl transferase family protein [Ottowia thiooxydans]|uniref:4'-phosphopantetheinyl transferase family protein n=1 Tax=Ottowia thiooxydans TaxID=219182 RepID=UPI000418AEE0|nr:4'-phosphopantetheinyl transferase superfamily protein [Ottowia thiooxydans]